MLEVVTMGMGRAVSSVMNRLIPGKRQAAALLVANRRTQDALPNHDGRLVIELVENGVDLALWQLDENRPPRSSRRAPVQFVFLGRLIDLKCVDLLLQAFARAAAEQPMTLQLVGDGAERSKLERLANDLGVLGSAPGEVGKVQFMGWKSQRECSEILLQADGLLLPSVLECGGAVVLEAMAMQLPVIATNWGGPADYLDRTCGILVEPKSPDSLIEGFAQGMVNLAVSPARRETMGRAGRAKVVSEYDWEHKVDRFLTICKQVLAQAAVGAGARNGDAKSRAA